MTETYGTDGAAPSGLQSNSQSTVSYGPASSVGAGSRSPQRDVRTLPSWIHSVTVEDLQEDVEVIDPGTELPTPPSSAQLARHNYAIYSKHRPDPGRLHDATRDRTPLITNTPARQTVSRWRAFARVSAYHSGPAEVSQRVDERWLAEHMPELDSPWQSGHPAGDPEKGGGTMFSNPAKRRAWYIRLQRALLRNPLVPLVLRLTMLSFSLIALALGASIFALSRQRHFSQRPSTLMAIIFDSIALVYLIYITYDEYSSKPLGLRSPKAKMRLILLDLFFIVFNSANLSLAFDTLTDKRGSCRQGPVGPSTGLHGGNEGMIDHGLCTRQSVLSAVLLIALFAWLLTFAVSVFRLVERVTRD